MSKNMKFNADSKSSLTVIDAMSLEPVFLSCDNAHRMVFVDHPIICLISFVFRGFRDLPN